MLIPLDYNPAAQMIVQLKEIIAAEYALDHPLWMAYDRGVFISNVDLSPYPQTIDCQGYCFHVQLDRNNRWVLHPDIQWLYAVMDHCPRITAPPKDVVDIVRQGQIKRLLAHLHFGFDQSSWCEAGADVARSVIKALSTDSHSIRNQWIQTALDQYDQLRLQHIAPGSLIYGLIYMIWVHARTECKGK